MQVGKVSRIGKGRHGYLFDPVHRLGCGGIIGAGLLPTVPNAPVPCSRTLERFAIPQHGRLPSVLRGLVHAAVAGSLET